jgi:hypothetical protein
MRQFTTKKGVELWVPGKGEKHPGAGRPKGSKNKMTVALQEAILLAAEQSKLSRGEGLVGYLTNLANDRPEVFARLLGKVMLLQEKQLAKTEQEPAKPVARTCRMRKSPRH